MITLCYNYRSAQTHVGYIAPRKWHAILYMIICTNCDFISCHIFRWLLHGSWYASASTITSSRKQNLNLIRVCVSCILLEPPIRSDGGIALRDNRDIAIDRALCFWFYTCFLEYFTNTSKGVVLWCELLLPKVASAEKIHFHCFHAGNLSIWNILSAKPWNYLFVKFSSFFPQI